MPGFQPLTSLFGEKPTISGGSGLSPETADEALDFDAILDPVTSDAPKADPDEKKKKKRRSKDSTSRPKRSSRTPKEGKSSKSRLESHQRTALDELSDDAGVGSPEITTMTTSKGPPTTTLSADLGDSFNDLLDMLPKKSLRQQERRVPSPPSPPAAPADHHRPHHRGPTDVASEGDQPVSRGEKLSSRLHESSTNPNSEDFNDTQLFDDDDDDDDDDVDALLPDDSGKPPKQGHTQSVTSVGSEIETVKTMSEFAASPAAPTLSASSRRHTMDGTAPLPATSTMPSAAAKTHFPIDKKLYADNPPNDTPPADAPAINKPSADKPAADELPSFLNEGGSLRARPRRQLGGSRRRPKQTLDLDDDMFTSPTRMVADPFASVGSNAGPRPGLQRAQTDSEIFRQRDSLRLDDGNPPKTVPAPLSAVRDEPKATTTPTSLPMTVNAGADVSTPLNPSLQSSFLERPLVSLTRDEQPIVVATSPRADHVAANTQETPSLPPAPPVSASALDAPAPARKLPIWMSSGESAAPSNVPVSQKDKSAESTFVKQQESTAAIVKNPPVAGATVAANPAAKSTPAEERVDPALVESLKATIEELTRQTTQAVEAQAQAVRELREVREVAAKATEAREEQHRGSLDALRSVHHEELESMRRRFADADRLANAEAKLEYAVSSFANLQAQISDRAKGLDVAQDAQLDARKRLVDDMELSAREARRQSEAETVKLQGLLTGMDSVMRGVRSLSAHEHERLHHEQARLSSLQEALQAQASASREAIAVESANLRARVASHEAAMAKLQDDVAADRAALQIEREELAAAKADFERHQHRFEQERELKTRALEKKETALRQLQQHVEDQSADLDRRVEAARELMIDADARDTDLNRREKKLQTEMRRLLDMHVDLEHAAKIVADRHTQLDAALQETARVKATSERAQTEIAVRQADLADAQAAMAEEAQRRRVENVKLVRERTELMKAKAGVHKMRRQWATFTQTVHPADSPPAFYDIHRSTHDTTKQPTYEANRGHDTTAASPNSGLRKHPNFHERARDVNKSSSARQATRSSPAAASTKAYHGAGLDDSKVPLASDSGLAVQHRQASVSSVCSTPKHKMLASTSWKGEMERLRVAATRSLAVAQEQDGFLSQVGCA